MATLSMHWLSTHKTALIRTKNVVISHIWGVPPHTPPPEVKAASLPLTVAHSQQLRCTCLEFTSRTLVTLGGWTCCSLNHPTSAARASV